MSWVLALFGALLGVVVAEERSLLGAVVGFFSVFALVSMQRLRGQVAELARELAAGKARLAALAVAQAQAAAAMTPAASAPSTEEFAAPPASTAPMPTAVPGPAPTTAPMAVSAAVTSMAGAVPPALAAPADPMRPVAAAAAVAPDASARVALAPAQSGWQARLLEKLKSWFTEGNVPVKVGVLVLLLGVPALLKYAAAQGYFTFPIEARLALVAGAAIAALVLGWRERHRRPAFGLSLQGGAIGVLLLTVFAAYRYWGLLPPSLAFALVVVLVAGSAMLALLQDNMALAVLGFLGGYLAPVLIATGSANHISLFSYYAVLNAAVFAISWRQSWRLLNLIGFCFTFGVGAAWGGKYYRPELFATVEPFLVLFFLFYIVIGLLYVVRQTEHRRPWVDGTLVFGTPLVAFPLQAGLLKDDRLGLAFSALLVALVYAGLVFWLRQRRGERLLTEAYGVLALGFATLAVPLAFSASTTAGVWALEGAGAAWLGLRQDRKFPWLAGLALQLFAAGAYCLSLLDFGHPAVQGLLLVNAQWLGAAILAFSGFALSLVHERHRPRFSLPALLFGWGALWWLVGGIGQLDLAKASLGQWRFAMLYLTLAIVGAGLLREHLRWLRLNWLIALSSLFGLLLVTLADDEYGAPLALPTLLTWLVYLPALAWALWSAKTVGGRSLAFAHLAGLWTIALAGSMQMKDVVDSQQLAQGWEFIAVLAPLAVLTLGLWRRPVLVAWPRAGQFPGYRLGWFSPAMALLAFAWLAGLFMDGNPQPLPFLPLLNPLELALLGLGLLLYALAGEFAAVRPGRKLWPLLAFAFVTLATLRAVHHGHGEAWSLALLQSGFTQASLTVVWSLLGVGAWIVGSRRRNRQVWAGGAVLMAIVLLKLLAVDRVYMGDMPGIVSVMVVGLLLVGVGYIAPSPPRALATGEPS